MRVFPIFVVVGGIVFVGGLVLITAIDSYIRDNKKN